MGSGDWPSISPRMSPRKAPLASPSTWAKPRRWITRAPRAGSSELVLANHHEEMFEIQLPSARLACLLGLASRNRQAALKHFCCHMRARGVPVPLAATSLLHLAFDAVVAVRRNVYRPELLETVS